MPFILLLIMLYFIGKDGVLDMYFDPGTGSLIVQLFLACVAGITSFFVVFRNNIKAFFSKSKMTKTEDLKEEKDIKKTNSKKKEKKDEKK